MSRTARSLVVIATSLAAALTWGAWRARAGEPAGVQWVWFDEGDPLTDAPAGTRYFRRVFTIDRPVPNPVDEATLDITADDAFTVWVNGVEAGSGTTWQRVERFDVKKLLKDGKNVIAVEAVNHGSAAGLLVKLGYVPNGMSKAALVSDGTWKASKTAGDGWKKTAFDDKAWAPVKVLGAYGKVGPWKNLAWGGVKGGSDRFAVPEGFRVEEAVRRPAGDRTFSLINMTFDDRSRLLVSREGGPTMLCTEPDKDGVLQSVKPYCTQVKNAQGMCWVKDALLLVGDGPQGTGLYRCRENKEGNAIETVQLMHKFRGGMGEHGPHAILHGPDGWLYLVIGNHAGAMPDKLAANSPLRRWPHGDWGPDQGDTDSTEDVLLPRQNDARGHAAGIRAPGGTIWRFDHEGKNFSLVAAGFRNEFDAAFAPDGELFTFDSDMEWDEGLPWYRPVRVCHCIPGAEFGWRTGSSKIPAYALDTLPAVYDTGRGSPVGLEFYDHHVFPEKYRGAYFMADWSIGVIHAVHLKRKGASYGATVEKFCTGNPMPVTDLGVGPDGALYFTYGGRNTQGGVYRIVYGEKSAAQPGVKDQPLAAWSAARKKNPNAGPAELLAEPSDPVERRAREVYLLGVKGGKEYVETLLSALQDADPFVRRRACEALIRCGIEPPVDAVWPLLADDARFLRTAARLVLQRIDPKMWADRLGDEKNDLVGYEAIIALCKTNQAAPFAGRIVAQLNRSGNRYEAQPLLDYLRTVQLALLHAAPSADQMRAIAGHCDKLFPHADWRVNRELAVLLTHFRRTGVLTTPVHAKLLDALRASAGDEKQQVHYFYCLRLLHDGWTPEQKDWLLTWYDGTRRWTGTHGHSFTPFLENILRDAGPVFTKDDVARLLRQGERLPLAAAVVLRTVGDDRLPDAGTLEGLFARAGEAKGDAALADLRATLLAVLGRNASPAVQAALRRIADREPAQRDVVAQALARDSSAENFPYLVRALASPNKVVVLEMVEALKRDPARPKADDPAPFRSLLVASTRLDAGNRWKAVELLRHWTGGRRFGAEDGEWKEELGNWARWFGQSFPKEAALPNVASAKPAESRYKWGELLDYLTKGEGRTGDASRGRAAFEKAQCVKCHKYGNAGEGVGPDLTTLAKRFKRVDVLESIVYPSKVISDQYRGTLVTTKQGQSHNGIASPVPGGIALVLSDGSKLVLKSSEVDTQVASLVSVMPENLLDTLEKKEIADLFAFLESEPGK